MRAISAFLFILCLAWVSITTGYAQQPAITANAPLSLAPGGSVTLSGPGGYSSYRWTRNNVDQVGTQLSITITTAGYYRVQVSNGSSSAVSEAVRVTVRPGAGSPDRNYSQEDVVLQAGVTTESAVDQAQTKKDRTITYADGLLQPLQQVQVKASPGGQDIIQFFEYDNAGRQPRQYLPYTGGADGLFKSNPVNDQRSFYNNASKVARESSGLTYAESVYEDTPEDAVLEQGSAGSSWQIAKDGNSQSTFQGHTKRTLMRANTQNEVALWTYVPGADGVIGTATYSTAPAQSITVAQLTDEDGKLSWRYTNMLGQVVAQQVLASAGAYLTTAYAYDQAGRKVMVMSPEGVKRIVSNGEQLTSDFLARWAYLYKYDERGRAVAKKVPGKDWEYTVYDRWDRPVASQNGNQRQQGQWAFVKYDELNRTIITGQISSTRTRQQLTEDIESAVVAGTIGRYENRADNNTGPVRIGYTLNKAWPASATGNNLLQVSYFDDYAFLNSAQARLQYQPEAASDLTSPGVASSLTVGLPTISQTRSLGSSTWLAAVTYYDDKARVIQSKSENQLGGVERFTTEYDYAGKVLKTYTAHNVTSSGPAHTIRYRYTYYDNDAPKELFAWFNRGAGTTEQLLSKKEYNELGQLVDDKLGLNPANGKYLQSVDYRYNIQGAMTHLNNRNLSDEALTAGVEPNADPDAEPDLFGLELKYDADLMTGAGVAAYNGTISESGWRSRRDNTLRAYAYHYDQANRITDAKYSAWSYATWSWSDEKDDVQGLGRFTTSGIQYDLNGNLTQMNRVGHKATAGTQAQFGTIDQLRYSYDGNRLRTVVDQAGYSDAPNDFEDGSRTGDDFIYDANGNMTDDVNKHISVTYNELDLPSKVLKSSGEYISFTYSATGEKLSETIHTNTRDYTVNYVGGFVYGQGPLLTVATPVGRALYGSTPDNSTRRWLPEYHIRDHLGNLRLAFRDEGQTLNSLRATMEPANATEEEAHFDNLVATRQLDAEHARTGRYAARLNAGQSQRLFGPSTSVAVSAGDSVRFEVYGRYEVPKAARLSPVLLPATIANASVPGETREDRATSRHGLLPKLAAGLTLAWTVIPHLFQREPAVPKASVKYDFYNQDSVLVSSQVQYLEPRAAEEWQQLVVGRKAPQAGYVVVSVQNASPQDVWFDDAALRTTQDMVVQENHYDPWGQNLVDIEVAGTPDEPRQYSDKERVSELALGWVDHGARYYDPQLGRWHSPDPADQFASPYSAMANNPVLYTDPDGEFIPLLIIGAAALIGGTINVATNVGNISSFGQGVAYFGVGLASGATSVLPGGVALSGAISGVGNSYLGGVRSVTGLFQAGLMGAGTAMLGAGLGAALAPALAPLTSRIASPVLQGFVRNAVGGLAVGGIIGTGTSLLAGASFGTSLGMGVRAGIQAGVIAGLAGGAAGYADARTNNLSPWTGKEISSSIASADGTATFPPLSPNKAGNTYSLRRTGEYLESVDDVFANPNLLKGQSPSQIQGTLGSTPGWKVEALGRGAHKGQGMILREYGAKGSTGRMIQWHPGGGHHGPSPYWKVSSGAGTFRVF